MRVTSIILIGSTLFPITGIAQSDPCWDMIGNIYYKLTSNGLANWSGISEKGCQAFQSMFRQVSSQCNFEQYLQASKMASQQSDSQYRQCQRTFPSNWEKNCMGQFLADQAYSQRTNNYSAINLWRLQCR